MVKVSKDPYGVSSIWRVKNGDVEGRLPPCSSLFWRLFGSSQGPQGYRGFHSHLFCAMEFRVFRCTLPNLGRWSCLNESLWGSITWSVCIRSLHWLAWVAAFPAVFCSKNKLWIQFHPLGRPMADAERTLEGWLGVSWSMMESILIPQTWSFLVQTRVCRNFVPSIVILESVLQKGKETNWWPVLWIIKKAASKNNARKGTWATL